ncbi:MAG: DUF559 domain-containing protein [Microbacterium sp.]
MAGSLLRVRKGRYLPGTTDPAVIRAARLGARVDCVSLLALCGVHVLDASVLHVQVTNGASRLPPPRKDVVRHWRESVATPVDVLSDLIEALARACRCQTPRDAIATLDSAWHLGVVDESGIAAVFRLLPIRYHALRPLLDPRAESGQESIVRLMLRALGCRTQLQVRIPTVGRVDFVVDGWLIVECDSKSYHEGWEAQRMDRRRDVAAARLGYTTIRLLAEDVLYRREATVAALRDVVTCRPRATRQELLNKRTRGTARGAQKARRPED